MDFDLSQYGHSFNHLIIYSQIRLVGKEKGSYKESSSTSAEQS